VAADVSPVGPAAVAVAIGRRDDHLLLAFPARRHGSNGGWFGTSGGIATGRARAPGTAWPVPGPRRQPALPEGPRAGVLAQIAAR
jgi:hypothetical protein